MRKVKGFGLIEVMLIMVVVAATIFLTINYNQEKTQTEQIDRTSAQMQQILNAGLSYFISHGSWPADLSTLQNNGYLPSSMQTPWGASYTISLPSNGSFTVMVSMPTAGNNIANARAIATRLPGGYTDETQVTQSCVNSPWCSQWSSYTQVCSSQGYLCSWDPVQQCRSGWNLLNCPSCCLAYSQQGNPPCVQYLQFCTSIPVPIRVYASVNAPGQNLSNATNVNFAGLYHHGACVPVPTCPVDAKGNQLVAQVFVVPVSVSGVYDDTYNNASTINTYPLSSFTAYAQGPATGGALAQCVGGGGAACDATNSPPTSTNTYWRACLQVTTEKGSLAGRGTSGSTATWWGQYVTMAAFTRCSIAGGNGVPAEPSGSTFGVYSL